MVATPTWLDGDSATAFALSLWGRVVIPVGERVQLVVERVDEFVDGELELVEAAVVCVGAAVLGAGGIAR